MPAHRTEATTHTHYDLWVDHSSPDPSVEVWRHGVLLDRTVIETVSDAAKLGAFVAHEATAAATHTPALAITAAGRI